MNLDDVSASSAALVGIDVGGPSKGYHAVAIVGSDVRTRQSADPKDIAHWCRDMNAAAIGVDAPCCWSPTGGARTAERALMQQGIWCFSTPTRAAAIAHPKGNFNWMLAGEALFKSLAPEWRLFDGAGSKRRAVFETFPHAIVCALSQRRIPAKNKSRIRRELLRKLGVDVTPLTNIDLIDAGLCALTAGLFLTDNTENYGDLESGFIVIPGHVEKSKAYGQ